MTVAAEGSSTDAGQELIRCLSGLTSTELARFTLQRPDVARVFAASLNALAVRTASSPVPTLAAHAHSYVEILSRLIERGDPSLARMFVPTHGALVDLAAVTPASATTELTSVLERLLDTTSTDQILGGLLAHLRTVAAASGQEESTTAVLRTVVRLAHSFLNACSARLIKDSAPIFADCARICFQICDKTLPQVAKKMAGAQGLESDVSWVGTGEIDAGSWQAQWLTCRVDVLQLLSLVLTSLDSYSSLSSDLRQALSDTDVLLKTGRHSPLIRSSALLDLAATSDSWPTLRAHILAALSKGRQIDETLSAIEALAKQASKFTGPAWTALQRLASGGRPAAAPEPSVSDEMVAAIDSVLPHYGVVRLRSILSRPTFAHQSVEMIVQRLLEGDEGETHAASPIPAVDEARDWERERASAAAAAEVAGSSLVKSRANVFGGFGFDASRIVAPKTTRTRVDELDASLKAAILARAEAESSDEDEEWNPFAPPARTVGVEDELDLDYDGRERRGAAGSDEEGEGQEEEEARLRERVLLQHYVEHGPGGFSSDAAVRRGKERERLREQTGWSDDLVESWAVMLDRNPRKDRLLAAASQAQLDTHLAHVNANAHGREEGWGPDKARGGRVPKFNSQAQPKANKGSGQGGQGSQGGQGGKAPPSARAAKHKEKQGNKARRTGHDKKMARVNP